MDAWKARTALANTASNWLMYELEGAFRLEAEGRPGSALRTPFSPFTT